MPPFLVYGRDDSSVWNFEALVLSTKHSFSVCGEAREKLSCKSEGGRLGRRFLLNDKQRCYRNNEMVHVRARHHVPGTRSGSLRG